MEPAIKIWKIPFFGTYEEIVDRKFKYIWYKYLSCDDLHTNDIGYLILDKAISHITEKIINTYSNYNCFLSFIPVSLTRYLQPLDVFVNKPFKEAYKKL